MGSLNFPTHQAFRVPPPVELTEQEQFVFLSGCCSTVLRLQRLVTRQSNGSGKGILYTEIPVFKNRYFYLVLSSEVSLF
jgi:hypothetical protein